MYTVIFVDKGGDRDWLQPYLEKPGGTLSIEGEEIWVLRLLEEEARSFDSAIPINGWEVRLRGDVSGVEFDPWTQVVLDFLNQITGE